MPAAIGENKKCSKCGEWKHVSAFYLHKGKSDGLETRCKVCTYESRFEYRHSERYRELQKQQSKRRYTKYRSRILARTNEYKRQHPERCISADAAYAERYKLMRSLCMTLGLEIPASPIIYNKADGLSNPARRNKNRRRRYQWMKTELNAMGINV